MNSRIGRPARVRRQLPVFVAGLALLAGCGPAFEQSPIENFVVVRIKNNSMREISVHACYSRDCRRHDVTDSIAPGRSAEQAFNNGVGGVIIFEIRSKGHRVGCIRLRTRVGQRHAVVAASRAHPCTKWPT